MRDIRVATVQFQHAAGDKAYNFSRIRHFVTEAARGGARVELIAFHAGWGVGGPPQAPRLRAPKHLRREPLHRVRHAARVPRGRADLLRQQHHRERARHGAAGRRDPDASVLPTSSGRRWLRARRPELYESLTRATGQEQETWRVRFGE